MKKECAIVIPVYTEIKKNSELIAIKQAMKIFKKYDIIAVSPEGLNLSSWSFTRIERFEKSFFDSISSYNKMMLSVEFYQRFTDFEFILIYQLDAYVFEDRLPDFCRGDIDYIGAPWLYGIFDYTNGKPKIMHVGNGGLSLRRVDRFIQILEELKPLQSEQIKNEDLFFSSIVHGNFRIASLEVAIQFAFERQVKECYTLNNNNLPMGCHAWMRYDYHFWKEQIENDGYSLEELDNNCGIEDILRKEEYDVYSRFSSFFENPFYESSKVMQRLQQIIKLDDRQLVIFGAGLYGKNIARWLANMEISVKGFCDNDRKLVGKKLEKYPIWNTNHISSFKKEIFVVIANYEYETNMASQLNELGMKRGQDYFTFSDLVDVVCSECS